MNARGADEAARCRSCGADLESATLVCAECGEPTAPPERKLVTVLFMDMTGYTQLVSRLDPEDVHDFVRPAMTALRRVVESFGGSVPQMQGDGFMAVFGAPVGHEDDAARALHAAVALHTEVSAVNRSSERLRVPALHVGVNTGEVLVAASREVGGFSVAGDTVNTAARLCSAAEPGQTLVGERTVELAGHGLRFGPARSKRLRGLPDPVVVHELLGLDAGAVARRPAGTFVGRRDALGHLHATLDDMVAARVSRVLVVTGEAGQGKSRLAAEFLARRAGVTVLRGRCTPYGRRRPLQAVVDAVATHLGVAPDAPLAEVEQAVGRVFGAAGTPALAGRVKYLIGNGGSRDGDTSSAEADVAALRAILVAAASAEPVILLVDDLQWGDPELVDAVCAIDAAPMSAPVLVMALTRPEIDPPRPLPSRELGALSDEDMRTLLADLLGEEPPEWLAAALLTRAGGNPLFLEECTRMLLETGGISHGPEGVDADRTQVRRVPNSMRMFIAARLDSLSPAEKRLLQRASVAGDTFHVGVLGAMSDEPHLADVLDSLVERGLLRRADGGEYHFKHVLIRDVAYESLARRDRSSLHRVVAEWLSEEPAAPVSLLAYHYYQAYSLARSDTAGVQPSCELARLAVKHLLAWGRSLFRYQARAAESALSQALEVARSSRQCISDETFATLLVERATALNELLRFGEAIDDLRTAEEMATTIGNDVLRARALLAQSLSLSHVSRLDRARELHAQAVTLLQRAGDVGMLAAATFQAAENLRYDDLPQMTRLLREAYDLYRQAGDEAGQAAMARYIAYLLSPTGGAEFRRWYGLAQASSASDVELRGRAMVRSAYAFHLQYRGEFSAALETAVLARSDAAESGARWRELDALLIQQECLSALGHLEESDRILGDLLTRAETRGSVRLRALALVNASRSSSRSRRNALAWQQLREGRAALARVGDRTAELTVFEYEAELLMDSGRWAEGVIAAEHAVDRAEANGWSLAATSIRLAQARCAIADGSDRAEDLVAEAMDAARRHDTPRYGALAAACLEQLSILAGAGESASLAPSSGDLAETRATAAENEGLRLLRAGSPAEAAGAFERAATAWAELGATVWLARALVWQAQSLRRMGDAASAARVEEPLADLLRDLDAPAGLDGRLRSALPG